MIQIDTHTSTGRGFSVIEILIASGIITALLTATLAFTRLYTKLVRADAEQTQASLLTEETFEILQFFRDEGWVENIESLATGTVYHIAYEGSEFRSTTTPILISDRYYRTFTLDPVYRDANGNVAETGDTDDGSRRALIIISRADDGEELMETEVLIHDLYE